MASFFEDIQQISEFNTRFAESLGGIYSDPFNETAVVVAVSDPKNLGRVKVQYQDGLISDDWLYVLGANRGQLSSQYIGAQAFVAKVGGATENAFVVGFYNESAIVGPNGGPIQIPILDLQSAASTAPESPGDVGLQCSKDLGGRIYLFNTEVGSDLQICLRRNNLQQGAEELWTWKSLTSGKWIEKGFDPGSPPQAVNVVNYSEKFGIPKCSQSLEGEVHEFSEDRKFRTTSIICRKDENEEWTWMPLSSPPPVFRSTLPKCDESTHGMEAILDSGDNSQLVACLRYQGAMKWIMPGKREPIRFHPGDPPLTRQEFLNPENKRDMPPLQPASPTSGSGFLGQAASKGLGGQILDTLGKAIPAVGSQSVLNTALGAIPPFKGDNVLRTVANGVINGNLPSQVASSLIPEVTQLLQEGGSLNDSTAKLINTLGQSGTELIRGIESGDVEGALVRIGQGAIQEALGELDPQVAGIFSSYISGGLEGALDAGVAYGLSQLPQPIAGIAKPFVDSVQGLLTGQPKGIVAVLESAVGGKAIAGGLGNLTNQINTLTSLASGLGLDTGAISQVTGLLSNGTFGQVAGLLGSFAGLPGMPTLPESLGSLPKLASTAMGLVGLASPYTALLGGGGIGLEAASALLGTDAAASIVGGLFGGAGGLGGLLGGAGADCPCDPKCRKTKHSEDSDGNVLLEPCGNVVANSHSSYAPTGDPLNNNKNSVAKALNNIPTGLGAPLCSPNPLDLTQILKAVDRLREMADRMESAKSADFPEFMSELTYTLEAIEKALQTADNNITQIESVERKLLDSLYRFHTEFLNTSKSFFPRALVDITENAKAIRDLQQRVGKLDTGKKGKVYGFTAPTPAIAAAIRNVKETPILNNQSRKAANVNSKSILKPADKEWRDMEPAVEALDLASIILGAIPGLLPSPFSKCKTKRDKGKVLRDSLESKLFSPVAPDEQTLLDTQLPVSISQAISPQQGGSGGQAPGGGEGGGGSAPGSFGAPQGVPITGVSGPTPSIAEVLNQIKYDQGRTKNNQPDC